MEQELTNASLPTWLKMRLREAAGVIRASDGELKDYADAGYHLGRYHLDDFCEDTDLVYQADEAEVMKQPSRVLRRIFRSEEYPRGELTDFVPRKHRRKFLVGLLAGASEESPGDFWLSRLEAMNETYI